MNRVCDNPPVELLLDVPAQARMVGEVRRRLKEFLAAHSVPVEVADDVQLAVSEACGNAVCHGVAAGRPGRMRVRGVLCRGLLQVEVADDGPGFMPPPIQDAPDPWSTSGRGLQLMTALMDQVCFEAHPSGTTVRLFRTLPGAAVGPSPEVV
jgi:serine/threonine-protein kinase RsbW